jgi:hypothetical protein
MSVAAASAAVTMPTRRRDEPCGRLVVFMFVLSPVLRSS